MSKQWDISFMNRLNKSLKEERKLDDSHQADSSSKHKSEIKESEKEQV
jgi:hypothetical protein